MLPLDPSSPVHSASKLHLERAKLAGPALCYRRFSSHLVVIIVRRVSLQGWSMIPRTALINLPASLRNLLMTLMLYPPRYHTDDCTTLRR